MESDSLGSSPSLPISLSLSLFLCFFLFARTSRFPRFLRSAARPSILCLLLSFCLCPSLLASLSVRSAFFLSCSLSLSHFRFPSRCSLCPFSFSFVCPRLCCCRCACAVVVVLCHGCGPVGCVCRWWCGCGLLQVLAACAAACCCVGLVPPLTVCLWCRSFCLIMIAHFTCDNMQIYI